MAAELVQFAIVCQKSIAKISSKIHLESLEHTHPPCEGHIPVFNILTYFSISQPTVHVCLLRPPAARRTARRAGAWSLLAGRCRQNGRKRLIYQNKN